MSGERISVTVTEGVSAAVATMGTSLVFGPDRRSDHGVLIHRPGCSTLEPLMPGRQYRPVPEAVVRFVRMAQNLGIPYEERLVGTCARCAP